MIDAHTHCMPATLLSALEDRSDYPWVRRGKDGTQIEYGPGNGHELLPAMTDIDLRLSETEEAGIDLSVLSVQVPGVDWFDEADAAAIARDVNDELVDLTRRHPERLAALAILPMRSPELAAAELERAVGNGLKGGIVFSNIAGKDLDAADAAVVFEAAAGLDVPMMIHPTYPLSAAATNAYAFISSIGFLVDTSMAALRLIWGGLYERHPDFKLYLCHAGSLLPQLAGRIEYECERFPGALGKLEARPSERLAMVYTDTVCMWQPALRSALDLVGPDRLMFGTDYPFWAVGDGVKLFNEADLSDEARAAIEVGNARRVFGVD